MNMKFLISLVCLCLISCNKEKKVFVQNVECSNNLGYDILRLVEKPIWLPDSIEVDFMGREGYLVIKDCRGNADLILYDDDKNIVLEGGFKESNIYKKRKIYNSGDSSIDSVLINIPIIDGIWKFNHFTAKIPISN